MPLRHALHHASHGQQQQLPTKPPCAVWFACGADLEREIDPQLFEVPPQCEDARRLTWAEISAVPELTLD